MVCAVRRGSHYPSEVSVARPEGEDLTSVAGLDLRGRLQGGTRKGTPAESRTRVTHGWGRALQSLTQWMPQAARALLPLAEMTNYFPTHRTVNRVPERQETREMDSKTVF